MISLPPIVRLVLTGMAAAAEVLIVMLPLNQTVTAVCTAVVAALGAVGIVPPHIETRQERPVAIMESGKSEARLRR